MNLLFYIRDTVVIDTHDAEPIPPLTSIMKLGR